MNNNLTHNDDGTWTWHCPNCDTTRTNPSREWVRAAAEIHHDARHTTGGWAAQVYAGTWHVIRTNDGSTICGAPNTYGPCFRTPESAGYIQERMNEAEAFGHACTECNNSRAWADAKAVPHVAAPPPPNFDDTDDLGTPNMLNLLTQEV